jgi:hypothetical protein
MTAQEMVDMIKFRTKQPDVAKILSELRAANRWVAKRVFLSTGGPDLLSTIGTEVTIAATARNYNLAAALAPNEILGIKKLMLKLPTDTRFTKMNDVDANNEDFIKLDSELDATPLIASCHPVLYQPYNFDQVRFAPAIPATSIIRVDYFRLAPPPDPTANPLTTNGSDLPAIFHDAIVNKATAHCFSNLDDTRVGEWETRARDEITDAIHLASNRTQTPTETQPFRRRH